MTANTSRVIFFFLGYFFINMNNVSAQAQTLPELGQGLSIQEVLKIVATHNNPTPAQINITLKNGSGFEGIVSSFTQSKNTLSLKNDDGKITLIDLYSIASLTIASPGSALNTLRGNKIFREETSDIPSRLALLRRVEAFNLANPIGINLELTATEFGDENCRFYTSLVLGEVELVLKEVGTDQLGREAIDQFKNGVSIIHKADTDLSITSHQDTLVLSFDCKTPLPSNFGKTIATHMNELL